jgi:copper chaperone
MIELNIQDMLNTTCARTIIAAIQSVAPDAAVEIDLKNRLVHIETQIAAEDIEAAIIEAGYTPVTAPPSAY